jgi:hypothetical protein
VCISMINRYAVHEHNALYFSPASSYGVSTPRRAPRAKRQRDIVGLGETHLTQAGHRPPQGGRVMKIQALIDFLRTMDPEREAVVTFFRIDGTGEAFEIEELSNHDGDAQLEIYEAEP